MTRAQEEPGSEATNPGSENNASLSPITSQGGSLVNPQLDTALLLASLGFYVGQTHPGSKAPRGGKKAATQDPGKLRRWWETEPDGGIYIELERSGLVDVAPDNLKWLAQFKEWGLGPTTGYQSTSGPGHEHHLFRRPEGGPVANVIEAQEYDIKSEGIAVIPVGVEWIVEPMQRDRLPEAPAWAVEMLQEKLDEKEARAEQFDQHFDPDGPPVRLGKTDMLWWTGGRFSPNEHGEVDRSKTLTTIAHRLAGAGASVSTIFDALINRDRVLFQNHPDGPKYANRNDPTEFAKLAEAGVREAELQTHAGDGLFGQSTTGGTNPDDPNTLYGITAYDIDGVLDRPNPVWTVSGLLQADTMAMVAGDYGTYKSFLTLGLSLSIALGQPWFGFNIKKPGPVVYVVAEGAAGFKLRIEAFMKKHGVTREDLRGKFYVVPHEVVITDKRWVEALNLRIEALNLAEPPAMVILDTLSRTFGSKEKENDPDGMRAYVDGMNAVRRRFDGCIALVVHHWNKSGGIRGANVLPADLATILETKLAGDRTVTVHCDKQKDADLFSDFHLRPERIDLRLPGKSPFILENNRDSVVLVPSSKPKSEEARNRPHGHKLEDSDRALIATLHAAVKEQTGKQLTDALTPGLHRATVKRRLEILRDTPMVNHLDAADDGNWLTGVFTLTDEGKEVWESWQETPESPS